jgi:hypothetical protein
MELCDSWSFIIGGAIRSCIWNYGFERAFSIEMIIELITPLFFPYDPSW